MQNILIYTKNAYFYYCFYGIQLALVIGALIYLYVNRRQTEKRLFIYGTAVLLLAMCPLTIYAVTCKWMNLSEYWKLYYLVPVVPLFAYVMTLILEKSANLKKKWIGVLIFVIIMGAAVNFDLTFEQFRVPVNPFQVNETAQTSEVIFSQIEWSKK